MKHFDGFSLWLALVGYQDTDCFTEFEKYYLVPILRFYILYLLLDKLSVFMVVVAGDGTVSLDCLGGGTQLSQWTVQTREWGRAEEPQPAGVSAWANQHILGSHRLYWLYYGPDPAYLRSCLPSKHKYQHILIWGGVSPSTMSAGQHGPQCGGW